MSDSAIGSLPFRLFPFERLAVRRGSVQDLQWNPYLPWVVSSVSEDAAWAEGGGTLQIWRPLDLLYRPDEDMLAEMHRMQEDLRGAE
mmetsp:Transcript_2585/g.7197  ORF Transcript_2585/g.7197 Transcript_2585/m.7197 type:complete len:87 (-) Transcript_2585:99-359(-)